jgi:hypothetical protein
MILPVALAALTVTQLAGCAAKETPAPLPPPPTAEQAASLKAAILEISPNAKVGTVSSVITESPLAMISDVDTAGVRKGDLFSIVDGSNSVVADAIVVETVDGKLAVRYTPVVRVPMAGDLAVKF